MTRCSGCYEGFSGPWCDNCDTWPCECVPDDAPPNADVERISRQSAAARLVRRGEQQ